MRRSIAGFPIMSYTMDCASGASPERLARVREEAKTALLGNAANLPFPEVCRFWPHVDLGAAFRAPVKSEVPTLFLSGTVDGRTPPENAEEVIAGFTAAHHVRIVNGGHDDDLLIASRAIGDTIVRFLQGRAPASDRIDLGPIRFRAPR
jgi:pimeloyl-ACP methyl ester carboxylesterase